MHYFPWRANPINAVDPIHQFDRYVQVIDEGVLYQWDVARFEYVEGRHYGRWVSDYADVSGFDTLYEPFQALMRLKRTASADVYAREADTFVTTASAIRVRAFGELLNAHEDLKKTV